MPTPTISSFIESCIALRHWVDYPPKRPLDDAMGNFSGKDNLSNPMVQRLIVEKEAMKRASFLSGAAWILEELDKEHPEWDLRTLMPDMLQKIANESE